MKKRFALLLAVAMVLSLAACGGNSGNGSSSDGSTNGGSDGGKVVKIGVFEPQSGAVVAGLGIMRYGRMQNGRAPENSLGNGLRHTFDNAAIKAGATYKLDGRNYFTGHFEIGRAHV